MNKTIKLKKTDTLIVTHSGSAYTYKITVDEYDDLNIKIIHKNIEELKNE